MEKEAGQAKQFLQRGWKIHMEIRELTCAKEEAFQRALHRGAGEGEKVQTSTTNTQEDYNIAFADYSQMLDRKIKELYQVKCEILQLIDQVDDSTWRALLVARYLNFKTWENIAVEMGYSWRQVMRMRSKALLAVQKKMAHDVIECHIPPEVSCKL